MAGGGNLDYKVHIVNATMFARKATLNPTVQMAHIKALDKGTAKYPLRSVDCKVYSIPTGAMSHTHENLFLGTLPKRLVLCCIDNDAYNGSYAKNPFHAKHNNVNFFAVYVDGRQVPSKPLQPNFDENRFIRSYLNLFTSTGKVSQDEGNGLTRDDFRDGYTFFGFDMTPDSSIWYKRATCASRCISLQRSNRPSTSSCTHNSNRCWKSTRAGTSSTISDGDKPDCTSPGERRTNSFGRPRRRTQRRTAYDDRCFPVRFRMQYSRRR